MSSPPQPSPLAPSSLEAALGPCPEAFAFVNRAALAMGSVPTTGERLYERIGELLREPFPDALVVVSSFDQRVTLFHPEAFGGSPETVAALERLLTSSAYGYDIACLDGRWKRLLEPRLYLVDDGISALTYGQVLPEEGRAFADTWGIGACYAMGLVHDRKLLGAVSLLAREPLEPGQCATVVALVQHASIALVRKRVEDELRAVAGQLQLSVGRRTQELSDEVTRLGHVVGRVEALLHAVDHHAALVDLDGRILACNERVARWLNKPMDQVVGRAAVDLFPASFFDSRGPKAAEAVASGRPVLFVEELEDRVREVSLHPVAGADGMVESLAVLVRDITDQDRQQRLLRRAGAFRKALFQSVSEGIVVLNERGVVSECNRAALASFGMEREELVGRPGVSLCAQLATWEQWEREERPQLVPGGESLQLEMRMRRMDGSSFMARVGASAIELPDVVGSAVWVVRDVTDELLRVEQLEYLATHDDLTGLPNRLLFQDRLERAREQGRRYGAGFALLLMDLDGFKEVNDTHGHELGDRLLSALGTRLRAALRAADTVSRLGGDEFAVLLPTPIPASQAMEVGAKLLAALERPFTISSHELSISASIGVALYPEHDGQRHDLLARADQAMYAAKRAGGAQVVMARDGLADRS
jgi:diguanylate cyclase (GGDEF)-like protein/PAS domain S-box-containing protein